MAKYFASINLRPTSKILTTHPSNTILYSIESFKF